MTATHILFVAWTKTDEKKAEAKAWAKFGNKNKSKSKSGDDRRFKVVVYKQGRVSENLMRMQTGQIYILGHGAAGYGNIANLDEGGVELSYSQVADRLIESGLKNTDFRGKIKCFNCHSSMSDNGKPAFATLFAKEMRERNYNQCQYFGYDSSVVAIYNDLGFGGTFKHAADLIDGNYISTDRASNKRKKVD